MRSWMWILAVFVVSAVPLNARGDEPPKKSNADSSVATLATAVNDKLAGLLEDEDGDEEEGDGELIDVCFRRGGGGGGLFNRGGGGGGLFNRGGGGGGGLFKRGGRNVYQGYGGCASPQGPQASAQYPPNGAYGGGYSGAPSPAPVAPGPPPGPPAKTVPAGSDSPPPAPAAPAPGSTGMRGWQQQQSCTVVYVRGGDGRLYAVRQCPVATR